MSPPAGATLVNRSPPPFDALAAGYDAAFTETMLGRMFRAVVWRRLDAVLDAAGAGAGAVILDVGCGTGVDAVRLARRGHRVHAIDVSPAMVAEAEAARHRAGVAADRLTTAVLAAESVGELAPGTRFDVVLANFGVLNCVVELDTVLSGVAAVLRPGGRVLLGVMGPTVPWEWAWFLARGDPGRARRRLRRSPSWRGRPLRYPRARTLRAAADRHGLRTVRVDALGALLPPPFAEAWAERHPATVARLERVERRWSTSPLLVAAADHYLVELVRR